MACEVFGDDRWVAPGDPWYRFSICSDQAAPVTADTGFQILVPHGLEELSCVDTIIVSPTYRPEAVPPSVFEALRSAHSRGCRILSLCAGAFVLAEAGLLDGRRTVTHWAECEELARRFPLVSVDPGALFVDDGDILTRAGSAASIDLCLHVVRQDYGTEVATRLARQAGPPQRNGGQAQYIEQPMPMLDTSNVFAETLAWLEEHLDGTVTVDDLALRSAMSPRTFARRFLATTGTTPYQWLLRQRVQLAQRSAGGERPADRDRGPTQWVRYLRQPAQALLAVVHTSPQAYRHAFRDPTGGTTGSAPTRPIASEPAFAADRGEQPGSSRPVIGDGRPATELPRAGEPDPCQNGEVPETCGCREDGA